MKTSFELVADPRDGVQGKGASRRLRRSGKVPAILYGGHNEPRQIILDHQNLLTLLVNERFFSTILALKIKGETQAAILKDVQRHPAKNQILHMDLQRVLENEKIRMTIPLHFKGAAGSPGVKTQGGVVSHLLNDVEVHVPAEGSAGVPRDRSVGDGDQRHQAPVGHSAARGRGAGRSRARSRRAGRLDPSSACRGSGSAPAEAAAAAAGATPAAGAAAGCCGSACCGWRRQEGRGQACRCAAGATKAAAAPKKEGGKK